VHWFALESRPTEAPVASSAFVSSPPTIQVGVDWADLFASPAREEIALALPRYLRDRRWFGGGGQRIDDVTIIDAVPVTRRRDETPAFLVLARVDFRDVEPATYVLPLAVVGGPRGEEVLRDLGHGVVAQLVRGDEVRALSEAFWEPAVARRLLESCQRRAVLRGQRGEVRAVTTPELRRLVPSVGEAEVEVLRTDQSNTSVVFGRSLILKLFRRLEPGESPEVELSRLLQERAGFEKAPPFAGALEYRRNRRDASTIAVLQGFVPNEGDAWAFTLDALDRFYEEVEADAPPRRPAHPFDVDPDEGCATGPAARDFIPAAALLGRRTGELHRALATVTGRTESDPEPLRPIAQRALYQSMRAQARRVLDGLRQRTDLPGDVADLAEMLVARQDALLGLFEPLRHLKLDSVVTRVHGDLHLGQVLYTGADFVFLDFEGEPMRPVGERRLKRPPMKDVAGMVRSLDYASHVALATAVERGIVPSDPETLVRMRLWAAAWSAWTTAAFVQSHDEHVGSTNLVPRDIEARRVLFDAFVVDKAIYEIGYEIAHRPTWAHIPLRGVLAALERST
jgi:maltose alpha-D-glucosyltransferase/alpha-amylase